MALFIYDGTIYILVLTNIVVFATINLENIIIDFINCKENILP